MMMPFDFFKHKNKCALCLRVISENKHTLDGKDYCLECYLKASSIQQQRAEGLQTEPLSLSTAVKTFVCECCKQALPIKYRHSDKICVDCASKKPQSSSSVLNATNLYQGKYTIGRYHHQELYLDHGALFFDGKPITVEEARKVEEQYHAYQAYMDIQKGGADYDETYERRGFVQDADGQWRLKFYKVDQYLHLISLSTANADEQEITEPSLKITTHQNKPKAVKFFSEETPDTPKKEEIPLYVKGDRREGETIILSITEDGTAKITDTGWWPASASASNGGEATFTLDKDYFVQNTLVGFIDYLTRKFRKDFSHLNDDERVQKLFDTPMSKDMAIRSMRRYVIENLSPSEFPYVYFQSLIDDRAAACFGASCICATFRLNVIAMTLSAALCSNVNPDISLASLSPEEMSKIAKTYKLRKALQVMDKKEDWDALFDEELKTAIAECKKKKLNKKC